MWEALSYLISGYGSYTQQRTAMSPYNTYYDVLSQNAYPNLYLQGLANAYAPGTRSISTPPASTIHCSYCGNNYNRRIMQDHHNCPTCAGGWD